MRWNQPGRSALLRISVPRQALTELSTCSPGRSGLLLHEVQVGLLARYGLQYCEAEAPIGDFAEVTLRLLLAINELYAHVQDRHVSGPPRRAFFNVEVQSAVLPNELLAHVIQRYYRLFRWCDDFPDGAEDRLPLRADFERLMFMSADEYLAAAFSVLSHFLAIKSARSLPEHPPFFSRTQFGSTLTRRDALDVWINRFSQHDYELSARATEPTFTVSDLAPFIAKPLVTVANEYIFCPLPSLLEDT